MTKKRRMFGRGLLLCVLLSTVACSTITGSKPRKVKIDTPGVTGAGCSLTSPTLTRYLRTPGTVALDKSSGDISIVCRKEGYHTGVAILTSDFSRKTWRKLLFGKVTGLALSAATGNLRKYPKSIDIYMEKSSRAGAIPDREQIAGGGPESRWIGGGDRDACGRAWAMDLTREGDRVSGTLWRGNIEYELRGEIDWEGYMAEGSAGKSAALDGAQGPRYLSVALRFSEETATGQYQVEQGDVATCVTPFALKRHTAD